MVVNEGGKHERGLGSQIFNKTVLTVHLDLEPMVWKTVHFFSGTYVRSLFK